MSGPVKTDFTLPLRKRRRPALSCVECRRRKIKCDRNDPCNHCKQSPVITCVYYKNVHPASENRRIPSSNPPTTSAAIQNLKTPGNNNVSATATNQNGSEFLAEIYPQPARVLEESAYLGKGCCPSTTLATVHNSPTGQKAPSLLGSNRPRERKLRDAMGITFSTFNDMVIHDGKGKAKLRTKIPQESDLKMYFYGESHWKHSLALFHGITSIEDTDYLSPSIDGVNLEIRNLLEKCKIMARNAKAELPLPWGTNLSFKEYFPVREVADKLVQNYFRTMECTHRILHIPSFHREYEGYWSDPQRASTVSVVKILLVMAIGICFYQEEDYASLRTMAQQWVYRVQAWASAPLEKERLNLSGLQVQCLLLLARQSNAVGGDLIWIGAGSLLRTAFQMGCHRDPKYFPRMSIMHGELRRRLWATVLEITVQTSLDSGMPPLIAINDFDTALPSNINDEDISEGTLVSPTPKPANVFTQTSMQIQLLKSLPTRYQISRQINDFHSEPPYDEMLCLGSEISAACKEATLLMNGYPLPLPHPTALQRNLLDLFIRRFLLAVHWPFALKSQAHPHYYFSRKVCLDTALIMASHPHSSPTELPLPPGHTDDYTRLKNVGGGIYKDAIMYAGTIVCFELIQQLEEEFANGLGISALARSAREPLHQCVRDLAELSARRIALGDNNVKWHLLLCAAMGQVDALEKDMDPRREMLEAARVGARVCLELLRERMKVPDASEVRGDEGLDVRQLELGSEHDLSCDFMMQDEFATFDLDRPDSWFFSRWDDNHEWKLLVHLLIPDGPICLLYLEGVYKQLDSYFNDVFKAQNPGSYGVILVDFPEEPAELIVGLVKANFKA